MPPLSYHQSAYSTKALFLGDSGAGKTGALASLAGAGYNIRALDMDSGLDVLTNILKDPSSKYGPDALARVEYVTITDAMKNVNNRLVPRKAEAWQRAIGLLNDWKYEYTVDEQGRAEVLWGVAERAAATSAGRPIHKVDLGPITKWGPQDILVIDSLTMLSNAALNFILAMNARLGQQPHQSDWYNGQQLIEGLLQMLYDEGVRCNVIVISHISYIGEEGGPTHGYPSTLGKALPPKVGRYFNTTLMAKSSGKVRKIHTSTVGLVELKNTAPTKVQADYPLETGLADYFKAVRGAPPAPK